MRMLLRCGGVIAVAVAVAVAHEEMHPQTPGQACEGDKGRQRDARDQEGGGRDSEADYQLDPGRK